MHKVIFLLVACAFVQVLANKRDWFPVDAKNIMQKCMEQHPLTPTAMDEMKHGQFNDSPNIRALILCSAKGLKVYSTEEGFDVERLAYAYYRMGATRQCQRDRIRQCVTQHKDVQPEDAMTFNVTKCILDLEVAKVDEDGPPSEWKGCD